MGMGEELLRQTRHNPGLGMLTKLMNTWPSTAGGLDPRGFQQAPEYAVNFPVHEWLPVIRNEDVSASASRFLTVRQVASEPRHCGVVQRHQSGFLELGFANQQTVWSDVGDQQMQRLRDSQAGCCQPG